MVSLIIVEPTPMVSQAIHVALCRVVPNGAQNIVVAGDGREAIDLYEYHHDKHPVVFTEVDMKFKDEWWLYLKVNHVIPIICITSNIHSLEHTAIANIVCKKPFRMDSLCNLYELYKP